MSQAPATQPQLQCQNCRFFIDDVREVGEELVRLVGPRGGHIHTVARKGGEKLEKLALVMDIDTALHSRAGVHLWEVGLCEKGNAHVVAMNADACEKFRERSSLWATRDPNWRDERQRAISAYINKVETREVRADEPCICGSGKLYAACCGAPK